MKRSISVRTKKRTTRPAAMKQQKLREEERKRTKYPERWDYVRQVVTRYKKRGA